MAEIIAVINQKGGTGKTTTSQNLGYGLSKKGKKVLFIDLDPQGNLTFSCGINEFEHSLADIIYQDTKVKNAIIPIAKNLDLVPTDIDLAHTELFLSKQEKREFVLANALKKVKSKYDFIIIDCQTSLSVLTINALAAAKYVIVPMQLTILSLKGLDLIVSTINDVRQNLNDKIEILGILPTLHVKRRKLSEEVLDIIKSNFELPVFKSRIGMSVRVAEAPSFGKSVMEYAPKCTVSLNYIDFVKEFLKTIK